MRPRRILLPRLARWLALSLSLVVTLAALDAVRGSQAAPKVLYVGVILPLTGADAQGAELINDGVVLASEEANAKGGVAGYRIELAILDDATAAAGQYDPAQAAANARKLVANAGVVAVVGPEMNGSGKAMSPILSEADLATITPSSRKPPVQRCGTTPFKRISMPIWTPSRSCACKSRSRACCTSRTLSVGRSRWTKFSGSAAIGNSCSSRIALSHL